MNIFCNLTLFDFIENFSFRFVFAQINRFSLFLYNFLLSNMN